MGRGKILSLNQNILVCITQQKTCERLIRKAAELRSRLKGELFVIHVAKNNSNFLDNVKEGEEIQFLEKEKNLELFTIVNMSIDLFIFNVFVFFLLSFSIS